MRVAARLATGDVVDLVVLSRDSAPLPAATQRGIDSQQRVRLHVHRVVGTPHSGDPHACATIARARNAGKKLGTAPWLMFLDDDVELEPDCIAALVDGLRRRPDFAALAADYLHETHPHLTSRAGSSHVAMGSTLFRRDRLAAVSFRWESGKCECQCCCDDLRRLGFGIGYLPAARARHARMDTPRHTTSPLPSSAVKPHHSIPGRILTAFDRNHLRRFRGQFLGSLRRAGNRERVTAVAYGLSPGERQRLALLPDVDVVALPGNTKSPALRRLNDFADVVAGWPGDTPVAHWDAGDVVFQASVEPLWQLVRTHQDRLLAAREPVLNPLKSAIHDWTHTIADPQARRYAFELLLRNPYLNGGFAAGTARVLSRYCREADRIRHSPAMHGSTDWGDQTALNLYCHADPARWREVDRGWNFCLHERPPTEFQMRRDGVVVSPTGEPIPVLHGNARTMRWFELSFLS
jgi:hypothetical protein